MAAEKIDGINGMEWNADMIQLPCSLVVVTSISDNACRIPRKMYAHLFPGNGVGASRISGVQAAGAAITKLRGT